MMHNKISLILLLLLYSTISKGQLPLAQISDLNYEGAFIVPPDTYGESNSNYAAGIFTLSADKQSFFLAGFNLHGAVAELTIPTIVNSDSLQDLNYATIKQEYKSFMDLTPDSNPQGIDRVSGIKVINNKLYVNGVEYYDAAANNTHKHTSM